MVRGDSTFYTADVAATAARYGADGSLTTGSKPSLNAAIAQIPDTAWTAIRYPNAFVNTETGELVSDAEVADIPYTAFASRPAAQRVTGRLTVRRVKRLNPKADPGQDGLCDVWRHHAVFVTSPLPIMPPGRCCGRSRTTSLARWAVWPARSMPAPPPRPSAPT
ncbi:hypothetical protein GCM10029964_088650 [Kibdelosporangium lantanae]